MKKSLIALAVASAFVAPVAMADTANVSIYGKVAVSFDAINSGLLTGSTNTNHVASNVSKIGFKGKEDLGDGLSAIWQIEQQVNIDNAGSTTGFGTRNTFGGLSSASMGTVLLGRHDTPYKIATRGLDLFGDGVADNRSIMGGTSGGAGTKGGLNDARLTDVLAYISPSMSGLTIAAATMTGAETATSGAVKGAAYSLAAMYNDGPINASLSYQAIDGGDVGSGSIPLTQAAGAAQNKSTAWKLGGSYKMDALKLNAIYEKTGSSGTIANALDRSAFYLAAQYNLSSSDAVKFAFTSAGKVNNVANSEATQFTLGYDHNLSKRTTVYALYSKLSNKSAAGYTFSQATSVTGAPATLDADPSVVSLGMKHSF